MKLALIAAVAVSLSAQAVTLVCKEDKNATSYILFEATIEKAEKSTMAVIRPKDNAAKGEVGTILTVGKTKYDATQKTLKFEAMDPRQALFDWGPLDTASNTECFFRVVDIDHFNLQETKIGWVGTVQNFPTPKVHPSKKDCIPPKLDPGKVRNLDCELGRLVVKD